MVPFTLFFSDINAGRGSVVGGKNASLGEMYNTLGAVGVKVPNGFAITTRAFRYFLSHNDLAKELDALLSGLDVVGFSNLSGIGDAARAAVMKGAIPGDLSAAIIDAYRVLSDGADAAVAVRSSATAEDLPAASFAGQHDSFLNISGEAQLLQAVQRCFASLYTDRAIKYRHDNGFTAGVVMSVGVQKMVRADLACSGVVFTLEPESGFRDIIHIAGVWGLGENIVQGTVNPDEYLVFKPSLRKGMKSVIQHTLGGKALMMVGANSTSGEATKNIETPPALRNSFVLSDTEVVALARWALDIESHYGHPMDIEWAKDGVDGRLYIVQARPETVHSLADPARISRYELLETGEQIAEGQAIGEKIASGKARVLASAKEAALVQQGDIIVTSLTTPDWDPILKKAGAIVTDKGGRTSHASIVAREIGIPAVVGAGDATAKIRDGAEVTVSCAEGKKGVVYKGKLRWKESHIDTGGVKLPARTRAMLIVGDPGKAFRLSMLPNNGVGLMRIEFIITHAIGIHPMALVRYDSLKDATVKEQIEALTASYADKQAFFIDRLAEGVATIAAAFYPKDVIVRMSDFKTNEYASLLGGLEFEPKEENPMIGFRGASRYYSTAYKEGFRLECEAMKIVRDEMGLTNVKLMIPFCRTVEEGCKVVEVMSSYGLRRGVNELQIYVMAEIPSNVILAEEFGQVFDGFSIGSNDLTQLTLGVDRDSAMVAGLFSEQNPAAKEMIATVIAKAKKAGRPIGLCGQAPSDYPEFAAFLVEQGIDSISFNYDALIKGIENINKAESVQLLK